MDVLPIDSVLPDVVRALQRTGAVVLEAPPGAGKTTRVPTALLAAGLVGDREIIVLEPRRLAARLAARRVADERGESPGATVGYQVRFEDVSSSATRVRYVTEGVLTRRILADPTLRGVGAVILDEFHERHLQGDLALALIQRLRRGTRSDLGVVVMSATLDGSPVADFLGAPRVRSEGRRYDVVLEFLPRADDRPLPILVAMAVRSLVSAGLDGDVLVFLPGAAEIRAAMATCTPVASDAGWIVVALHGDLPAADQDRAVTPGPRRKVILSTNVAETSVTIDGVVAVIDSGLARVAGHAPWSGLPTLKVARISRASAAQRAGRAGRTRPGRCLRLYTRHDHDSRPEHDAPEVARLDLAEAALELHAAGVTDLRGFGWFEAPPEASLVAAEALLQSLGAVDAKGKVTDTGRRMLRYPLHPRLGRMLVEAETRGVTEDACLLGALLGERDIVADRRTRGVGESRSYGGMSPRRDVTGPSDLAAVAERFMDAEREDFDTDAVRALGLDVGAVHAVDRVRRQLVRLTRGARTVESPGGIRVDPDEALRIAVLAGYPDRVARRLRGQDFALAGGGTAWLSEASEVRTENLIVAVDAEERMDTRGRGVLIRAASGIEPEWLMDLFADDVRESMEARWNADAERADVVQKISYRGLTLDETRGARTPDALAAASRALAEAAVARGAQSFVDDGALDRWLARASFAATAAPEANLPVLSDGEITAVLRELCVGRKSFAELRDAGVLDAVRGCWSPPHRAAVERLAPERVALSGGRVVEVHYAPGAVPWIASRLQDFFGMSAGPSVATGRVLLVLHLLAPNHQAVQVTTDLAGFWQRHYPAIRKELSRRYPRHAWPEDGRTAVAPQGRR